MKNFRLFLLALAVGSMTMFTACDAPATDEGTDTDTTIVADDAAGDVDVDANTEQDEPAVEGEVEVTEGEAVEGEVTEGEGEAVEGEATEGEATEGEEITE